MTWILLADDHDIMRSGIKLFITSFLPDSVIDEVWNGDDAIKKITKNEYHLIILDINMPGIPSLELVRKILAIKPQSKILMCSMNAEEFYARKYLQAGAKGYVSKNTAAAELRNAINAILNN